MSLVDKVIDVLETHGGKGTLEIPKEIMDEYLDACKEALESVFAKNTFRFPRPSSMNHGARKMYYMRKEPELFEGEEIPYNLRNTFYLGHMSEAYLIAVAKLGGVEFDAIQKYTEWQTTSALVGGTLDYIIDGVIWDAKTANDRAYTTKWKNVDSLKQHDQYGYVAQGTVYSNAENKPFGGWHVFNKNNGMLKEVRATEIDWQEEADWLEHNLDLAFKEELPPVCHQPVTEVYKPRGKPQIVTGNKHLHSNCVKCPVRLAGKCQPAPIVAVGKRSSGSEVLYSEHHASVNPNIKVEIL